MNWSDLNRFEGSLDNFQNENFPTSRSLKETFFKGRNPLEAIQLSQQVSLYSGVSHAFAAVLAIENSLNIEFSRSGQKIRSLVWRLSYLFSHIQHFYFDVLPDYLNERHLRKDNPFLTTQKRRRFSGDLNFKVGASILSNLDEVHKTLNTLSRVISMICGKFPIVMNFVPGGVSNFAFADRQRLKITRELRSLKIFIEEIWLNDVKDFIKGSSIPHLEEKQSINHISFGSPAESLSSRGNQILSPGVLVEGKLEPLNINKITVYGVKENSGSEVQISSKGVHYDTETAQSGALSRLLVTHYAGVNPAVSDAINQIVDELNLSESRPNSFYSRLLAENFEGRLFLESIFETLLQFGADVELCSAEKYDFSGKKVGVGFIESPSGSLMHRTFIEDGKIRDYQMITGSNWNISVEDEVGKAGVVFKELLKNALKKSGRSIMMNRVLHSYYFQPFEASFAL